MIAGMGVLMLALGIAILWAAIRGENPMDVFREVFR